MKKIINIVRVFDGEKLTTPTSVVIEDGYISNIGDETCEADEIIDGESKTLLPGFIDTHIHIDSRDNCVQAVKYGVTTLIDQMCENTALIDSLREPDEPIASVRSVYMPVIGTDANHTNAICYLKHGESLHRELELLSEAGLSNVDILRGTTVDAAKELGLLDRGSIVPGKRADLVLVDGDPTKDISVCRNIRRVWVKGIEVDFTK